MDWEGTLALIFCAVIPLGLVNGIVVSKIIERERGKETAEKYFTASKKNRARLDEILQTRIGRHLPAEIKGKVVHS